MTKRAFAIAAHPDDIEFQMAGTLILLQRAGYEIHYMNVANGCCGSAEMGKEATAATRRVEAMAAAVSTGAVFHESLTDDLMIFYEPKLLARLAAVMREVAPEILLVQSPQDYMEDHQNSVRLAVSAAFVRGMPNCVTDPPRAPVDQPVTVYHAQPHGNVDPLRQAIMPDLYVDISSVIEAKRAMLACHVSQKAWLDRTQGMDAYLNVMQEMAAEVGIMSGQYAYAEGWRRHSHMGFSAEDIDPLKEVLGNAYLVNEIYEEGLG